MRLKCQWQHIIILFAFAGLIGCRTLAAAVIKVACVGDSITVGAMLPTTENYPTRLGALLGADYEVRNFGVGGHTLLRHGDLPYVATPEYQKALLWKPDLVLIMLGTNDTVQNNKRRNWQHNAQIKADAKYLIQAFRKANPHVRVLLCSPLDMIIKAPGLGLTAERKADLLTRRPRLEQVRSRLQAVAHEEGVEFVDMWTTTHTQKGRSMVIDGVHPTAYGAEIVARRAYQAIVSSSQNKDP